MSPLPTSGKPTTYLQHINRFWKVILIFSIKRECTFTCAIQQKYSQSHNTTSLLAHELMHVNIWFRFVWLTWLKGLVWELCTVGKTNQPRWWFMGRGLFSLGKNKTLKPKNSILKEVSTLNAWVWQASHGQIQDTAPSADASELQQQHSVTVLPRKTAERIWGEKSHSPALACWARETGQPKDKHKSGLCFRVIPLLLTTDKQWRLI